MKLSGLFKPEYLLNPRQLVRRVGWSMAPATHGQITTRTPWDWPITVFGDDVIGKGIIHLGVYDLVVCEVLSRLCDAGEMALDIGANIGFMTAVLAKRVGRQGRVLCFEAHPEIAQELQKNVVTWQDRDCVRTIRVFSVALSDRNGTVSLECPEAFNRNRGLSRVIEDGAREEARGGTRSVPCATLDSILEGVGAVGVAKLDVEGHEEAVLRGASRTLTGRVVRDWVFEHHAGYPSPVIDRFEASGYALWQIQKRFFGPALAPIGAPAKESHWEAKSFLATLDPVRAVRRVKRRGWQVLQAARGSKVACHFIFFPFL
jgi:FkbM family methyltransferase